MALASTLGIAALWLGASQDYRRLRRWTYPLLLLSIALLVAVLFVGIFILGPTTLFVTIIITLRSLEVFDTVNILTRGGPEQSSEVLLYTLYVESFGYLRTGYGASITVVFLLMVTSLLLLQTRIMDRRVHYS